MSLPAVTFTKKYIFTKCMMRADALNSHVYPLRTEMTARKKIPISHICSTNES